MRTVISTITGLSLLVAVFLSGGASLNPDEATPPPPSTALAIAAPFSQVIEPAAVQDILRVPTPEATEVHQAMPDIIDPIVGQPLNEWFGCRPPQEGSICILRPTGIEPLIPPDPDGPEDWRPLVEVFFHDEEVDLALKIMACESRGDRKAKNPTSTASGLFQHLASMWPPRAEAAGWKGADVFDPVANVAVAAWLVHDGGGWRHWNSSRGCWG